MPLVFADTSFWIARNFPDDQWHEATVRAEQRLASPLYLLTTQEVLSEFLASVAGNEIRRNLGVRVIDGIQSQPRTEVIPQSIDSFTKGLELYRARMDKRYSLVNCISMNTMTERGLTLVFTSDRRFEQENSRYVALMRQQP